MGDLKFQTITNKDKYPDSLEIDFKGPRNGGKIYFDSSDKEESKTRLDNFFELAKYKDELLKKHEVKHDE